jgi:N,N-dimethylformamidase
VSSTNPVSLVPGVDLEGYADEVGVRAGSSVGVMLSSGAGSAAIEVVRLIHGDPSPRGPGVREEPVDWGTPATVPVTPRPLDLGSHVEIPGDERLNTAGDLSVALWVLPTHLNRLWQVIAARWEPGDLSFGLFYCGHHTLTAAVSRDGETVSWITGRHYLWLDTWQLVVLTYAADRGELCLHIRVKGDPRASFARRLVEPGRLHGSIVPLRLGALYDRLRGVHYAHFNGKLAAPALFARELSSRDVDELAQGARPSLLEGVVAAWDFGREVSGTRVVCVGDRSLDGRAVNAPTRAVTGPHWENVGGALYTDDPATCDAIHLHDDDLADAGWPVTFSVAVPAGARSGIYAVRCRTARDGLTLPFVVRARAPSADICFLVPTYTWLAYGNNRARDRYTEDGVLDRAMCLYDVHADGSMVRYCTRRKPTRSGDPAAGLQWGAHGVTANLYLIDWLEAKGLAYDVICDEHLHRDGHAALAPYRCVILGSHPEYWTGAMLDGLRAYIDGAGRVLYLGGNGLYWVTSVDAEQPWVMEVRKSGDGDYEDNWSVPVPGELQHSTTLEIGGLWARRGRPPRSLMGVEMSSTSDYRGELERCGYERLPASRDPEYEFVFAGVEAELIGDFGLNLGFAAGYEMDTVQEWPWGEGRTVLLAHASSPGFVAGRRMPVALGADLALTTWPNGGAVFAAAAVTWTGSLSHNGYNNDVSRITENVLRRFLTSPAGGSVV